MAQVTQIVPEFSFPHVMTVINDYTKVKDIAVEEAPDTSIKQIYAITSSKGPDNVWVKLSSRNAAIKMFGDSNFKKYGQPLMQALDVLDRYNSQVWLMRVMPESAKYANNIISIGYKADEFKDDAEGAHNAKFRFKITATPVDSITNDAELKEAVDGDNKKAVADDEGFTTVKVLGVRYIGRGQCGNYYSLRMSKNTTLEQDAGITMYNFSAVTSETVIETDANIVGGLVTSGKYDNATLVDDVISDAEIGVSPVIIHANEEGVEKLYNAYVEFLATAREKIAAEYEAKLAVSNLSDDELTGKVAVSGAKADALAELQTIEKALTDAQNVPDLDEFDPFFAKKVGSNTNLPFIMFVDNLPAGADLSTLDPADYTVSDVVDLTSVKGVMLFNGNDGEFENPSEMKVNGEMVKRTYEEEVEMALVKAYDGTYDKKILSSRRMPVSAYFDANYPMSVKKAIVAVAELRADRHVWLDAGINHTISSATAKSLASRFVGFDSSSVSVDVSGYTYREKTTNKKCDVTINMFLAPAYVDHLTNIGFHIPFVKSQCKLSGHVKNTLFPLITDADTTVQGVLYDNRLNYFECTGDNKYNRCVQNTTQKLETDLLEENNDCIIKTLKTSIEDDVRTQIYNFADESVRQNFIIVEKAKYASWNNNIVQSFDIHFATSEYEFEKSILHCYVEVVLRGLTKSVIVEIDINKREYTASETTEEE